MTTIARFLIVLAVGVVAFAAAGCGPAGVMGPGASVPNAQSSFVAWAPVEVQGTTDVHGSAVDEVATRGGEIVRLVVRGGERSIDVAERARTSSGTAESWSAMDVVDGIALVRPGALSTALLVRRGAIDRAYVGQSSDPGYYWFELEDRALAWADGPLASPVPAIAPPERFDLGALAALDGALQDAALAANRDDRAMEVAHAIRRIAVLRAVRALRPPSGYPYFFDDVPQPAGAASPAVGDRSAWLVAPGKPIEFRVEGPALLHVWSRAAPSASDETLSLRVLEGGRVRAESGSTLPRATLTSTDPSALDEAPLAALRRAIVHVPPGTHAYAIEIEGGAAVVSALRARAVVHAEDALSGEKNEAKQIEIARRACGQDVRLAGPCLIALALAGEDVTTAWEQAWRASSPLARGVAQGLAAGGPRDPSVALEVAASRADPAALTTVAHLAGDSADGSLRAAWTHALMRGTRWAVSEEEAGERAWPALLLDEGASGTCGATRTPWVDLAREGVELPTRRWHGVPVVELLAAVPCGDARPVHLSVDGEMISAQPSSAVALWHVRVEKERVRVARLDSGGGHVFAIPVEFAACDAHWQAIHAPHVASESPKLAFGASVRAPGIEVWVRSGARAGEVVVEAAGESVRIAVGAHGGFAAFDEHGDRWLRAARVALPPWAAQGAVARGGADVAVRAIERVPRDARETATESPREAEPIDPARALDLSRRILAAPSGERAALYLERALLLARGGAASAAMEDARAARALGARDAGGEDPVTAVRAEIRVKRAHVDALPPGVRAYGIEADFDPSAPRCAAGSGPRAHVARAADELSSASHDAKGRAFDRALAARVLEAVREAPLDPRGPGLAARALAESRWRLRKQVEGGKRVRRERSTPHEGAVDGNGELRARVVTGEPFEPGTYVTITSAHPAKAFLVPGTATQARIDLACAPRAAGDAVGAQCPLSMTVGSSPPIEAVFDDRGRATVRIPIPAARSTPLSIAIAPRPGRWVALARIVFDHEVPNSTNVPGVGWILEPPHAEARQLVAAGERVTTTVEGPSVLRVDALAEPGVSAEVALEANGKIERVPADGTPIVTALLEGGRVAVSVSSGAASVAIAERVPVEDAAETGDDSDEARLRKRADEGLARVALWTERADAKWRDVAERSPQPLTPIESVLGTAVASGGAVYGTLREGLPAGPADAFAFVGGDYRRRIESIGLWTDLGGVVHDRTTAPSYAGALTLYEEAERAHVRATATAAYLTQNIAGQPAHTIKARAFVEYSWRATRDFFVLPRLGYDGYYPFLSSRPPKDLTDVDDDVYNPYRYKRQNFVFGQALLWFTPFFDDIFYVRSRVTFDWNARSLSHLSARPGVFLALGQLDLSGFVDNAWYAPTDTIRNTSYLDVIAGAKAFYNFWYGMGSLDVQPGAAWFWRPTDGGWQVSAFVNVLASRRRGLRDFSSLELDFPEQLGGGIPWRGATSGGYR